MNNVSGVFKSSGLWVETVDSSPFSSLLSLFESQLGFAECKPPSWEIGRFWMSCGFCSSGCVLIWQCLCLTFKGEKLEMLITWELTHDPSLSDRPKALCNGKSSLSSIDTVVLRSASLWCSLGLHLVSGLHPLFCGKTGVIFSSTTSLSADVCTWDSSFTSGFKWGLKHAAVLLSLTVSEASALSLGEVGCVREPSYSPTSLLFSFFSIPPSSPWWFAVVVCWIWFLSTPFFFLCFSSRHCLTSWHWTQAAFHALITPKAPDPTAHALAFRAWKCRVENSPSNLSAYICSVLRVWVEQHSFVSCPKKWLHSLQKADAWTEGEKKVNSPFWV